MKRDVNVNSYLPPVVKEAREFKQIAKSENPEFNLTWDKVEIVWNNQYIMDCTVEGVIRWERIIGITPKSTDSLYDRKIRIITYINQTLPFTMRTLKMYLLPICGEGNYDVDLDLETNVLTITLNSIAERQMEDIQFLLDQMIPANLIINLVTTD